jgi:Transglycosylase SLT domain
MVAELGAMKALQATCIVGAITFTAMIPQLGGNTPGATVPEAMPGAAMSAETLSGPVLSAVVSDTGGEAGALDRAELGSVAGAGPLMARAEIGDETFEAKWTALGHRDAAQPMPKTHDAPDGAPNPPSVSKDFRYLIYYVWSELPPAEKPAAIVLRSLKDTPVGTPVEEIKRASEAFGLDANFMRAVAKIESDFNPKQRTGSYIGLFQLSEYEFNKFGSGKIRDPRDNAVAAAYKVITEGILFEWVTHRKPTLSDLYLIHQQGWEGAAQHISQPDRIAWKSMCATSEGKEKGEKWCKRAIWGNTLPAVKRAWGSVDKLTSEAFVGMWRDRVAEFYSKYMATAVAERTNQ